MSRKKSRSPDSDVIAANPKAHHLFAIEETLEAGLMLHGSEVKAMRRGGVSLRESYVGVKGGSLHLLNTHIPELKDAAPGFEHKPRRPRALLLHRREHKRLLAAVERKGYALLALKLYFNRRGIAKLLLGVGKGKTKADKRESERTRDWNRQKAQLLRRRTV